MKETDNKREEDEPSRFISEPQPSNRQDTYSVQGLYPNPHARASTSGFSRYGGMYVDYRSTDQYIMLPIQALGKTLYALVDTGASVSTIHYELIAEPRRVEIKPDCRTFRTITNQKVEVEGKIKLCTNVLHTALTAEYRVIKDLPFDCVFGLDILLRLGDRGIEWWNTRRLRDKPGLSRIMMMVDNNNNENIPPNFPPNNPAITPETMQQ